MRAAAVPRTEITIGRGTVAVRQDELDRLLKALAELEQEGAASIADEIGALRVAGVRIHLLPDRVPRSRRSALRSSPPSRSRARPVRRSRASKRCSTKAERPQRRRTTSVARMPSARWFATLHHSAYVPGSSLKVLSTTFPGCTAGQA